MCRDEITSFALFDSYGHLPDLDVEAIKDNNFFIHPIAISTELKITKNFWTPSTTLLTLTTTTRTCSTHYTKLRGDNEFLLILTKKLICIVAKHHESEWVVKARFWHRNRFALHADLIPDITAVDTVYSEGERSFFGLAVERTTQKKIAELIRGMFVSAEMLFPTPIECTNC